MTFKPTLWQPIAAILSAVNLVAVGFAAGAAEPWHAAVHAGLGLGFGLWAQRLGQVRKGVGREDRLDTIDAIEAEMSSLRGELSEVQERLDFTERMLAQGQEARRVEPER